MSKVHYQTIYIHTPVGEQGDARARYIMSVLDTFFREIRSSTMPEVDTDQGWELEGGEPVS